MIVISKSTPPRWWKYGYCPVCGYTGLRLIPQHAEPKTGLTCKHLTVSKQ